MPLDARLPPGEDDTPRPARLVAIALLPSAATLGNLLCGFFALLCCLLSLRAEYLEPGVREVTYRVGVIFPTYVTLGAYLVVVAMLFDALDGRLARIARRTSEFGAQLDSLADIVSFGVAPMMLFVTLLLRAAAPVSGVSLLMPYEWRLALLGVLVYVSCAAIRLARYNVENVKDESGQNHFSGLPVPGAGAALVALLLLHENLALAGGQWLGVNWPLVTRLAISPLAIGLGLLMISRLNYVHFFNMYVRREQPLSHLVWLVVIVGFALWWMQFLLVVLAFAYVLSGLVFGRRDVVEAADGEPGDAAPEAPRNAPRARQPLDLN